MPVEWFGCCHGSCLAQEVHLALTTEYKVNKSVRRIASSPAGYILYCNIFIIKPYNIGHTDLDVFVCIILSHRYNNPGMTILHEIVIKIKGKITEA